MAHRVGMPRFLPLSVPFFFFPNLFALYLSLSLSLSFSLSLGYHIALPCSRYTFSTLFFSPFQWAFVGPLRPANDTHRFLIPPQAEQHEYGISEHEHPSLPFSSTFFRYGFDMLVMLWMVIRLKAECR